MYALIPCYIIIWQRGYSWKSLPLVANILYVFLVIDWVIVLSLTS
jgi:hypothetical protein